MSTVLRTKAQEEATFGIPIAFVDDADAAVTPSAATWTLTDQNGVVVNSRSAVAISPLSTTATIVLSGQDLALTTSLLGTVRVLLVEFTYTSSLGSGLPGKHQIEFEIENLVGVT